MISGVNTIFEHGGKKYHLQSEDLGQETAVYEIRVYDEGAVLWLKRMSYSDLVAKGLPKGEFESALRTTMEKTLLTVEAAITRGKIG